MRRAGLAALTLLLAILSGPLGAQNARVHTLPATPQTIAYGYYWADARPVLTIASGDVIDVETMITNRPDRLEAAGVAPNEIQQSLRDIVTQVTDRGPGGHILTGPVFVQGADSGDVLEVHVLSIDLAISYGYNGCSGFIKENCEQGSTPLTRILRLDARRKVGLFAPGIEIPLRPFFGSMGVAPPRAMGRVSSNPPGVHAGNLDNRELVTGTTLYIPVHVAGALFEVGDGHAAQGDGEVDQTAIETSLRGKLRLTVRKDMKLDWPRAETPTHWITMGMDQDLTNATRIAVQEMVKFLMEVKSLSRVEAYQLASMAADLRITQLVDGNVGVHMMVAKSLLSQRASRRRAALARRQHRPPRAEVMASSREPPEGQMPLPCDAVPHPWDAYFNTLRKLEPAVNVAFDDRPRECPRPPLETSTVRRPRRSSHGWCSASRRRSPLACRMHLRARA